MPSKADTAAAAWFDAFGEGRRVTMLRALVAGEKSLVQLALVAETETPNALWHLQKLKRAGAVSVRLVGRAKFYALANATVTATAIEFTHRSGLRAVLTRG